MKNKKSKTISKAKELEISLVVKPICKRENNGAIELETCKERAQQETRKLMDDIWKRYPMAQVSKANFDSNNVVFEL